MPLGIAVNSIAGVAIGILTYISDDAAFKLNILDNGSFAELLAPCNSSNNYYILNLIGYLDFLENWILLVGESEAIDWELMLRR